MTSQTETGEKKRKGGEKRCTSGGGVGVVAMIESFPARSEVCQNAEGPPGPPGKSVSQRGTELRAACMRKKKEEKKGCESY